VVTSSRRTSKEPVVHRREFVSLSAVAIIAQPFGAWAQQLGSGAPPPPRAPISGRVLNGRALSLPTPQYPRIAVAERASGIVVVQVLIDEAGNVVSAQAVSGHPLLTAAAVNAARQAKFSPTKLSGQPVKVTGVIQYSFTSP
jgi:protein TonB